MFVNAQQSPSDDDRDQLAKVMQDKADRKIMLGGAQRRYKTAAGRAYAKKFIKALRPSLLAAMLACDRSRFKSDASHDIIFVVAASGKIERVLQRAENPYGECVGSHVALPETAPKPPSSPWFVQIHLLNGPRDTGRPEQPYAILSLPSERQRLTNRCSQPLAIARRKLMVER